MLRGYRVCGEEKTLKTLIDAKVNGVAWDVPDDGEGISPVEAFEALMTQNTPDDKPGGALVIPRSNPPSRSRRHLALTLDKFCRGSEWVWRRRYGVRRRRYGARS